MSVKPATADELLDRCTAILSREMERLERSSAPLNSRDVYLVGEVARAAREIVASQLDPLGVSGRKKLREMTDEQVREVKLRLLRSAA